VIGGASQPWVASTADLGWCLRQFAAIRLSLANLRLFRSALAKANPFAVAHVPALYELRNEAANRVVGFRNGLVSKRRYTTGKSGCDL
jgi:hypothetical protein